MIFQEQNFNKGDLLVVSSTAGVVTGRFVEFIREDGFSFLVLEDCFLVNGTVESKFYISPVNSGFDKKIFFNLQHLAAFSLVCSALREVYHADPT